MKKDIRIAIRIDSQMNEFLRKEANKLDNSIGYYVRQVLKEKMNGNTGKKVL